MSYTRRSHRLHNPTPSAARLTPDFLDSHIPQGPEPLTYSPVPHSWDDLLAELTLAPVEMHRSDREAGALYHDAAAFRAPCVLGRMSGNVADVYVVQTFGVANSLGAFQRR